MARTSTTAKLKHKELNVSHVALVDIVVDDLECLEEAASNIGMEFRWDQKTYKWFGKWVQDYHASDAAYHHGIDPKDYGKCEHAISVKGNSEAYEVGVCKNPNGDGYVLIWDFWQGGYGLRSAIGDGGHKLIDEYTRLRTIKQSRNQGMTCTETVNDDGEIVLELIDYS